MSAIGKQFGEGVITTLRLLPLMIIALDAMGRVPPDRQVAGVAFVFACIALAELILIRRALETRRIAA